MNVVEFKASKNPISDEELKRRFEEIKTRKPDPDWARLFAEARAGGRTQEEISKVVGVGRQRVTQLLFFSDWIAWLEINATTVANPEFRLHEVTERKFRQFWNKHSELKAMLNERRRAVLADLIDHQNERDRHDRTKYDTLIATIKANGLVNSKKYRVETIAEKIGYPADEVKAFLKTHQAKPAHGMQTERISESTYKIHKASGKMVPPSLILGRIEEILDELKAMGAEHPVKLIPYHIQGLAMEIEKILKEMDE